MLNRIRRLAPCFTVALLSCLVTPGFSQETDSDDLEAMLEKELAETGDGGVNPQLEVKNPKVQEAANQFLQRNFEEAERLMKEAKADNPQLPPAGVLLGSLYSRANNPLAARAAYEKAVRDEPEDPEPYVVFGENAIRQRRFTDAALLFDKAIEVAEAYNANAERKKNLAIRGYLGAALVAQAREQWEDAENWLRQSMALRGEDTSLSQRLGQILFKKSEAIDGEDARKQAELAAYREFERAYNMDTKKVARPEINMARMYQASGREENAKKLVAKARERDPDGLATQVAAAQWAIDSGDTQLLADCAAAAMRIDGASIEALVLDGFKKRLDNDHEGAETSFRAAHATAPSNATVLNQLAISLAEQPDERKKKQALEFAQMSTRMHADLKRSVAREAAVTLGWVFYRMGNSTDAARAVQSAINAGQVGPEAAYMAARIAADRGNEEAARVLLKSALDGKDRLFPHRQEAEELLNSIGE